jgi:1-deoxy-D-xylulose-5-phosphate synthase
MAADMLASKGTEVTVADARFAKPLDKDLIRALAKTHSKMVVVEEGSMGGFGSFVLEFMARDGLLDHGAIKVRALTLPDMFQDHDTPDKQYEQAGLNAKDIVKTISGL